MVHIKHNVQCVRNLIVHLTRRNGFSFHELVLADVCHLPNNPNTPNTRSNRILRILGGHRRRPRRRVIP